MIIISNNVILILAFIFSHDLLVEKHIIGLTLLVLLKDIIGMLGLTTLDRVRHEQGCGSTITSTALKAKLTEKVKLIKFPFLDQLIEKPLELLHVIFGILLSHN